MHLSLPCLCSSDFGAAILAVSHQAAAVVAGLPNGRGVPMLVLPLMLLLLEVGPHDGHACHPTVLRPHSCNVVARHSACWAWPANRRPPPRLLVVAPAATAAALRPSSAATGGPMADTRPAPSHNHPSTLLTLGRLCRLACSSSWLLEQGDGGSWGRSQRIQSEGEVTPWSLQGDAIDPPSPGPRASCHACAGQLPPPGWPCVAGPGRSGCQGWA